ncbi:hypothetical protein OGAPHI_005719 [Ogataea philodendri]|uniref:Uncharacterized protein n=1 Tax=Ogataea philodendri TaxID=1378263 RepID=A0A9P8NZP1_9ASCO|nr:uncharacterized protein OGAPHI_005719 [Ogataea philodendri]KAH3662467.1 hypothetical protein OGAPHI_005719 [Ogataea philodendri]
MALASKQERTSITEAMALNMVAKNIAAPRSQRGQKVGRGLSWRTFVSHGLEKLFGLGGWTKINLVAFVKQHDVIKQVVGVLRALVNRSEGRSVHHGGRCLQGSQKFQSSGGIQTSGGIIPTLDFGSAQRELGSGNTLTLTTRNTLDEVVTDLGVESVRKTVCGHINLGHVDGIVVGRHTLRSVLWGLQPSSKLQGLTNSKLRVVLVVFGRKRDFSLVVLDDIFWSEAVVGDDTFGSNFETKSLRSDGFQEGGTSCTRTTQNKCEGSRKQQSVHWFQNIKIPRLDLASESVIKGLHDELERGRDKGGLVVLAGNDTTSAKVTEGDSERGRLVVIGIRVHQHTHVLDP